MSNTSGTSTSSSIGMRVLAKLRQTLNPEKSGGMDLAAQNSPAADAPANPGVLAGTADDGSQFFAPQKGTLV